MTQSDESKSYRYSTNDDLVSLLESIADVGATVHGRIAAQHFESFLAAKSENDRRVFALEIFCKLMQSLEDYGAFCLMWLEDGKTPFSAYLDVVTPKIIAFFRECDSGIDRAKLRKIWGISTAKELIENGSLSPQEEVAFENFVSQFLDEIDENLRQIGLLFRESGDSARRRDYGDIVNMYFNAKHGVKAFFSTKTSSSMGVQAGELTVIIGPGRTQAGDEFLKTGKFTIGREFVQRMVQNAQSTGKKLQLLARLRLECFENPQYILRGFREFQSEAKSHREKFN